MSKNKFSASINKYGSNTKVNESSGISLSNNMKSLLERTLDGIEVHNDDNVINLDKLSLSELTGQLSDSLYKRQPIFLWSKKRENNKILLDVERQEFLKSRIESLKSLGQEIMDLRADAIVSEKLIELLSLKKNAEAEAELLRVLKKSKTEDSYYNRKIKENELMTDKFVIENKLKDLEGLADVDLKKEKIELYRMIREKIKDGSIKDMPVEILHEILNSFNSKSGDSIETIAKYNKVLGEIDKTKAESYKLYNEGENKRSDTEEKNIDNYIKYKNYQDSLKKN